MTPSGVPEEASQAEDERSRLLRVVRRFSVRRGRFILASGAVSDVYLDLRLTTTSPEGALLASRLLLREATERGANRIGGPTLGADPLVGAAMALAARTTLEMRGFLVRPKAKDHGAERRIEGHLAAGDRALVLDDVVTSGGSILRAAEAVRDTSKIRRGKLLQVPKDYYKIAVMLKIPEEKELQRRLSSRPGKHIPATVIQSMISQLTPPTEDEGFDKIINL